MNKRIAITIMIILAPFSSQAQQMNLNQEQMQQLMQQAQQMQACMSRIDQTAMIEMGQKAQAMEGKIKSLCQANKRDEALSTAIEFGRSMANDENIKIARECGEMTKGMLPRMEFPTSKEDTKNRHICDGY
ncbi:MAG: hypothetical protein H6936_09635 [Burkholderiales bacterium]|nr:hypothetical protein [Nitrosomonas sp.]MCP5275092.1 hypothetical protein [Burkholderiales bacterium]